MRSGLTPKASFGRSRVARRGRPGSGCLCRSAQAAALRRWSEGPRLFPPRSPLPLQVAHGAILGPRRGGQGLRAAGSPQSSHHCGLPCPPPYFGGKAAGQPLIGPAERRGAVGRGGWTRASVFNFSFFPPLFLSPQVSCFSSFFPSACSLPSPALSGCEGMFRNSTAHARR